jgi:hypothetical protein
VFPCSRLRASIFPKGSTCQTCLGFKGRQLDRLQTNRQGKWAMEEGRKVREDGKTEDSKGRAEAREHGKIEDSKDREEEGMTEEDSKGITEEDSKEITEEGSKEITEEDSKEITEEGSKEITEEDSKEITEEGSKEITEEDSKDSKGMTKEISRNDSNSSKVSMVRMLTHRVKKVKSRARRSGSEIHEIAFKTWIQTISSA